MYARTKTGIAPEFVRFMGNDNQDMVKAPNAPFYLLRPETVETMFVLFQLTGDEVYREWGWEIFTSIEQYCRTDIAYASIDDVGSNQPRQDDRMESFFLAETLKYLYLLMDPETEVDILKKVRLFRCPDKMQQCDFVFICLSHINNSSYTSSLYVVSLVCFALFLSTVLSHAACL
jgi:hypothetical protein